MDQLFKNLGLNKKETETFLKMLELGAQPASIIAKHINFPRSSTYLILENLKALNLIEEFKRAGIKYFKCIPIKNISNVLKAKQSKIEHTLEILAKEIPTLESLENKLSITPKINFFEGHDAVMNVYENVLKEKEFYTIFNPKIVKKIMPIYVQKAAETIKKEKLNVKELIADCKEAKEYIKAYKSANHQIKILPNTMQFDSDTIICDDHIFMISYGEKDISAVGIYNKSLAQTQKTIFEQLWRKI
ncbi:MAG: Sugar-specific transcriptional regulator TrmB [Candidatus Peregrinibacteria bacterium GW2011_GWC2_39_14]|nr:MAG: Sugar-specific transcriptional regulator TrmB [Candidatus Peregrinibacteria bacterium GW2011_GWC2_39_14]